MTESKTAFVGAKKGELTLMISTVEITMGVDLAMPGLAPFMIKAPLKDVPDMAVSQGNLNNPLADFYLLSRCAHFVIANSSFSWWSAWLGHDEDAIIYAPSPWNLIVPFDPTPFDWRRTQDALIYP